jgi:hypothetical protein
MHLESKTRRGMVLFIVVAMLALFAVVSVAFYYYATQESMASRLTLDAQQRLRPDPDALFAYALRTLVFGTTDPNNPPQSISPFVKYSLLRNLFGDQGSDPFSAQTETTNGTREQLVDTSGTPPPTGVPVINPPLINPPYTYPDEIHAMLGRLAIDTGQLVALDRSFVRRYTLQQQYFSKVYNDGTFFYIGRPSSLGRLSDPGGDVRNLPPGIPVKTPDPKTGQLLDHYGNDSIWMDLGFPVQTGPDGRTYKPLFAFFITELDSRLDLNAFAKSFRYAKSSGTGVNRGLPSTVSPLPLGLLELESLYRHGDTGADAFASVLFGKGDTDLLQQLKNYEFRHSLTLNSSDLMWAGLWPLGYNPGSGSSPSDDDYDTANGRLWPRPLSPWYGSPWRLNRRLNLNDVNLAKAALEDKQRLARDIYFRLLVATGKLWDIYDPTPPTASWKRLPNDPIFRELAQIAVNMVDYLDPDDEPTPFFYACDVDGNPLPDPSGVPVNPNETINATFPDQTLQIPKYQVYGIELPRLVINEVLAEYEAPPAGTAGPVTVRVWVELWYPPMNQQLLNPPSSAAFNPIPLGRPKGTKGTNSAYRLVLAAANPNYAAGKASPMYITEGLRIPASANEAPNVVGVPAEARNWDWTKDELDWDDAAFDTAAGPITLNPGDFLIIGPSGNTADNTLGKKPPVQTDSMKYTLYQDDMGDWFLYDGTSKQPWAADDKTSGILVLLQRLRDPSSPHDPVNNPYITVDWVHLPGPGLRNRTGGAGSSVSYIRVKANKVQGAADGNTLQPGITEPLTKNTRHSLGDPNTGSQSALPQDLIVHLDDVPSTSALDLLFVSGLKPYEVSNNFDSYNGGFNSPYLAPWFKGSPPYHRFFELVDLGPADSHRISGRLNLHAALRNNGKFDLSNFKSLVDLWKTDVTNPVKANFGWREAKDVWDKLLATGSPFYGMGIDNLNQSWLAPSPPGTWYLALGAPPTYDYFVDTDGDGIPDQGLFDYSEDNDTTHSDTGAPRPHPYNQSADNSALAGRLWNKITTRSNVFAVWCTVGFFEARVDPTTGQVLLGPEIDADVGRQVRYRFFAIVDRTIIAEWMLQNNKPVETQLGRTDIDPRRTGPNDEPPCVIYWSRIQ